MQESRLFKIVYYLLDRGTATAPELAERFEVSVRTIYRDIDALSGAGIPIYAESGRNGGIRLMPAFTLDRTILSVQEKSEILSSLEGLGRVSGMYSQDTMEKLSALFGVAASDWLEVDFSRWGDLPRDNRKFEELRDAVIEHCCVKITYVGTDGRSGGRIIEPLKLLYKAKDWYLKAYCRTRQGFRLFKLSRILEWELLKEEFTPKPYPETTESIPETCGRVVLRFAGEMAYRVYDEFDASQIRKDADESLMVTATMPQDDWLTGYLLSFGTQVEILEPRSLAEIVMKKAKEIYEKHKS